MKRFLSLIMLCMAVTLSSHAQYRGTIDSRGRYHRVTPSRKSTTSIYAHSFCRPYFGLRLGPSFTNITGDDYSAGDTKTGVNVGMAIGIPVSLHMPLALETGLYYTEKGEAKSSTEPWRFSLDYLEVPLVFKYHCYLDRNLSLQPYFGGYVAVGVSGKARNTISKQSYNAFGRNCEFRRGDAGLKLGLGFSYDMFYADLNYDWGLANISKDSYYDARNSAVTLNLGVNF